MIDALLTKKHPAFGGCRCVLCLETWANQPHAWQVDAETVGPFTIGEIEACEMVYRPRTEAHGGQTMTWIIKPAHFSAIEQSIKVGQAPWLALTTQSVAGKPALVMSGSVPGAWTIGPPQPLQCEGSIQASTGPFHRHGIARGMVKPVTPPTTSGAWLLAYINFAEPGGKCMELHLIWNYIRPMNRHTLILSHSYGGANNSAELGVVSPDSWSGFELQVYRDGCKCSVNQGPPVKMAVNLPGIASLYPWQWCLFFGQPGVMDPAWAEIEMGTSE